MILKTTILLSAVIFIWVPICYGVQQNDSLTKVTKRVEQLEEHNEMINEKFQMLSEKITNKFGIESQKIDLEIGQIKNKLEGDISYIKIIGYTVGSVTILGLIISIIALYRKIYKVAAQKVEDKFETLFNENREKLIRLIQLQDEELQLKQNKKIIVLSGEVSSDSFLRSFFATKGFRNVRFEVLKQPIEFAESDVVLFNNEDNKLDKKLIQERASKTPKETVCFYFGASRIEFQPEIDNRVAYANSKMQLYGNFMNALKYQELLR